MFKEFKEFAMKGNMAGLAVGVVIGGAFSKIVTSLVNDIIMPLAGLLMGKVDFSNLFIALGGGNYKTLQEAKDAGVPTLNYGIFINNIIDFLIVAFSIFIIIQQISKLSKKKGGNILSDKKKCKYCFTEIDQKATKCPNCTSELK
ncbi:MULTISPECIES: large conductance mechanosensitive channel protein MscL [unclassified Clostridium]|uniref:large conductance mechanosensitive channel protein MscL n=1 Tax=unclassified Clostridium TaxID=2614128 RepID=UPI0002982EC6|nr:MULTISPECIES: large conductance mechanosensitive channel protein MscL [unclassified Clostridium]EKQ57847.1 MAG: large conductance mechanosensitive channel protein [Clostridium sp. Maddingley MBC34-26]